MTRSPRSRKISTAPAKAGHHTGVFVVIVAIVIVVPIAVLLIARANLSSNRSEAVLNDMAAAFNKESDVSVVISGAGRPGSLSVSFDGSGDYESVVSGKLGGTLLDVGGAEYIKAGESALYATMTGEVPLPVARAREYAQEYANEWINMEGAPSVSVSVPIHDSGSSFFQTLGGGSGGVSLRSVNVRGVPSTVIKNTKVTWTIDSATSLPESFSKSGPHGTLRVTFSYGTVATLKAPNVSVIPPGPVNTSLSPKNYPNGLSAFSLVYTEIQQTS